MNKPTYRVSGICLGALVLTLSLSIRGALATESLPLNIFSLSSEVSSEIDNDLMVAMLAVQAQHKDPAVLANEINQTMAWAIEQLEPFSALKTKNT